MITPKSIATLVVFIISMVFVIHPVYIPVPVRCRYLRPGQKIPVNLTTAPIVAIAILWAAQCLNPAVIRAGIVGTEGVKPYNILILFFSLAYMAITLDATGILQSAAYWVSNKGGADGWKLFFYFYVMLTLISVVIGNDPVILSGTAFLVYYTEVVEELKPLPWLISEFAAANTASMVLFVGNPTNVVICEGFGVNNAAFTLYTIFPFLACNIACFIALAVQYRSSKHLPRRITPTQLDVRSVLHDPVSAWVGSIWLGSCLVVIIVVSFFNIDVWMISLPFAVVKFFYDLGRDHYKVVMGKPTLGRGQGEKMFSEASKTPTAFSDISWMKSLRRGTRWTDETLTNDPVPKHEPTADIKQHSLPSPERPAPEHPSPEHRPPEYPPPGHLSSEYPSPDHLAPGHPSPEPSSPDTHLSKEQSPISIATPSLSTRITGHFPTFFTVLPRLPFALVPFAFSQFILIEALTHQGWIDVFATWLVRATHRQIYPTIWLIGVLGVILCNISGTNIGATILLTKVVRAANMPPHSLRAAAIALAVASNIGAVSFTFSASLAGLLWRSILEQKKIRVRQREFAKWNALPLTAMTVVGLSVVSAEMAALHGGKGS